jgi:hypothetical protein
MKVVTSAAATIVTETISGVDTTTEFESSSVAGEWKGGYQSILTRCPTTRKAIQSSVAI